MHFIFINYHESIKRFNWYTTKDKKDELNYSSICSNRFMCAGVNKQQIQWTHATNRGDMKVNAYNPMNLDKYDDEAKSYF